jgi:aminoglycoside phosphotransferase (APT) family kinase protein
MNDLAHKAGDRVDATRLENYLRPRLDRLQGPLKLEQFTVGQSNPTYRVSAADGRRYVLRKKPSGLLLPSAHAVEREFRVITALHAVGFPVARPLFLCEDDSVIGTPFYLMDFVEGRGFWDQALPGLGKAERYAIWDELNRVIARLHAIDYQAIGLADYGKTGNYLARQIGRWSKQYRAPGSDRIEAMDNLIEWLPLNIPAADETSIVHGDFRLDNVIFHPTEPRILAVLDWELSTLGDPLADFAYLATSWHMPVSIFPSIAGLDLEALGIPSERQFVQTYCGRMGRATIDPAAWNYYIAYNLFRVAAIAHGVGRRAQDGNASNAAAAEVGKKARPIAEVAWALVEKMARTRA